MPITSGICRCFRRIALKRPDRTFSFLALGLLSLFLAVVCLRVGGEPPARLGDALDFSGGEFIGPLGVVLGRTALWAFGPVLQWLLPVVPWAAWPWISRRGRRDAGPVLRIALVSVLVAGLLAHPVAGSFGLPFWSGGALGSGMDSLLGGLLGKLGSFLLMVGGLVALALPWLPEFDLPGFDLPRLNLKAFLSRVGDFFRGSGHAVTGFFSSLVPGSKEGESENAEAPGEASASKTKSVAKATQTDPIEDRRPAPAVTVDPTPAAPPTIHGEEFALSRDPRELLAEEELAASRSRRKRRRGSYPLPSLDLLTEHRKEERGFTREALQMKARLLLETLQNFGIEGQINEIRPGPVITTFEFQPGAGVKVSQITSRTDDLALAMEAVRIRIVAPIPGKAAVGIEIPNPYPQVVGLREVVGAIGDDEKAGPLTIALGKDTEGKAFMADMAEMPHLLVAGATGSGKSVCINAIICNLLLRNGPDRVRMLMIDPKMLELSVYNGIPHLMHPVITDPREALKAVKWMVVEMTARYDKLSRHSVRNILEYNAKVKAGKVVEPTGEKIRDELPYIVLVIDELADLMMQLGSDLETPIARLAQMARAVGIHLVLATQRPSVNVITGIIKANFPSRIAFRVISRVDSRTILDGMGAENLLGKGDMLSLLSGMAQPVRVHGAYLSMEECEAVVEHWKPFAEGEEPILKLDTGNGPGGMDIGEDDLLEEARKMVILSQSGSTTMLQRRLRIGYTRASRLMDMLEGTGVVGSFEGSKARKVLIAPEELEGHG